MECFQTEEVAGCHYCGHESSGRFVSRDESRMSDGVSVLMREMDDLLGHRV
jgi:hypothetical protein